MVVSILLARGGSKGILKKNIIDVNGRPLLYYTLKASMESEVDETWVSTDDDQISQVASSLGAKVLTRPPALSTDQSTSESALIHFAESVEFDTMVFIQPTSPFLQAEYINKGLSMMKDCDSVFSVYAQHWVPKWTKSMPIRPIDWDVNNRPRRQDAEDVYVENGAFYITTKECLLKSGIRSSGKIGVVEMSFGESHQIDTYRDLEFMRRIIK